MFSRVVHVDRKALLPTVLAVLVMMALCVGLLSPIQTLAGDNSSFANPLGNTDLAGFLLKILNALIYILFPIIILMMVYTGFLFVAAQGNPAKVTEARTALLWAVVGGVIVLGAWIIVGVVQETANALK